MAEREYLDYDDWLRAGGLEGTGQQAPPDPIGESIRPGDDPNPQTKPTPPSATNTGGGKSLAEIEAEGRAYDAAHGYVGGYMMDGVWVNGSPTTTTPGNRDTGADLGAAGEAPAFNWSQFSPSKLAYANYTPKYGPFSAPTLADAEKDPGYQFARDQGSKALENSAAGRGVLRTGGTLKDILEYGNKFGEQNYNGVFNRNYQTWQGNNEWDRNNYTTNRDTAFGVFDRNYRGEKDSFDYLHDSETRNFTDQYNRWRDRLNSLTQIATHDSP